MDFFFPCWVALGLIYNAQTAPSKSYINVQSRGFAEKLHICSKVAIEAKRQGVDPILAIAVAKSESGFKANIKSGKGAQGPLGVMPRYHCPEGKAKGCDFIKAGVSALDKVLEMHPDDRCKALAVYNRGLEGKCADGRSEYGYAMHVLDVYNDICAAAGAYCETC